MGITKAERDGLLPYSENANKTVENGKKEISKEKTENIENDDSIFSLKNLSLENLLHNIYHFINQDLPLTLWGGERQNKKISVQNEKLTLIKSYIENLRTIGFSINELRADTIFNENFVQRMAEQKAEELEKAFQRDLISIQAEIEKYQFDIDSKLLYLKKIRKLLYSLDADIFSKTEDVNIKKAKVDLHNLVNQKFKDGTIKELPIETLHEIFGFFDPKTGDNVESIAKYNKIMEDVEKTKSETFKTYAEGRNKLSESESKEIANVLKFHNFSQNLRDNSKK